jgi:hypothetical protein
MVPDTRTKSLSLANIPLFILSIRPLYLVELYGGIATRLKAFLKSGHAVASYTWSHIDPDAHAATTHKLTRLYNLYPLLFLLKATLGRDTRLLVDTTTITLTLFS